MQSALMPGANATEVTPKDLLILNLGQKYFYYTTVCFIKPYRDPVYKCTGSR